MQLILRDYIVHILTYFLSQSSIKLAFKVSLCLHFLLILRPECSQFKAECVCFCALPVHHFVYLQNNFDTSVNLFLYVCQFFFAYVLIYYSRKYICIFVFLFVCIRLWYHKTQPFGPLTSV